MTTKWTHPELGTFKFLDPEWSRSFRLPAFKRFTFREFGRNGGSVNVELTFSPPFEEPQKPPSKLAVNVARRVIKNEAVLAEKLETAIWQDLNGKGRETGMWWHGDLPSFNQTFKEPLGTELQKILQTRESVRRVIGQPSVDVVESVYGYDRPCAKLTFAAAFDPEHGVGVLTDGSKILGVGYEYDVGPYKTKSAS